MTSKNTGDYEYREGICIHCRQQLTWGRRLYCADSPTTWHEVASELTGAECARNGVTSDGRRYHYSAAHNGYVFDE